MTTIEETRFIPIRDARDRLSEWLGLGAPHPLRDLPVPVEGLTVPFGQPARIPIELSQLDVIYELHDHRERPVREGEDEDPISEAGTGQTIHLQTPIMSEDSTYKLLARKTSNHLEAYLQTTATVKVGLDTALIAQISSHPPLDSTIDIPVPTDPRLAAYGDRIEVEILSSQEGVDYRLVHFVRNDDGEPQEVVISVDDVRGTSHDITLNSQEIFEDTVIRIMATKEFEPSEGREDESELLDIQLPLKVKANRGLDVGLSSEPIADFGVEANLSLSATQPNVEYRAYLHRIDDAEYVHNPATEDKVVRVQLPGEPEVQVERPLLAEPWAPIEGFEPEGGYQDGNGGILQIPIRQLTDDCMLVVEARKHHKPQQLNEEREERSIPSSVWLQQPAVLLRRPDPSPPVSLQTRMDQADTDGLLRVLDGQPGVYYYFRTADDGEEIDWPAYFHKRDAEDPQYNQGIGQLEVEIDLAIAAEPDAGSLEQEADPARRPPEPPLLETLPLAAETVLHIRAVKAQTGIQTPLGRVARIASLPVIRPETPAVAQGSTASLLIIASLEGQAYQLTRDDQAIGSALDGNGQDLVLVTDAIAEDTMFEVWVTRPDDPDIPLLQKVPITVLALPDAALPVSAAETEVDRGEGTIIQVSSSQRGVSYQLRLVDLPVGGAVAGTGNDILLETGAIDTNSIFTVRATKEANDTIFVDLIQEVSITVRAEN